MRPLHLVACKDDLRPTITYIRIKNGVACATDAHSLVMMPLKELFPTEKVGEECSEATNSFTPVYDVKITGKDEELYFNAKQWGAQKMDKAVFMKREGNLFRAFDKRHSQIGMMEAITGENFYLDIGRYPDVDVVMIKPDIPTVPVDYISFNPDLMVTTCKIFGTNTGLKFSFYGRDKAIGITHSNSEIRAIVMPMMLD